MGELFSPFTKVLPEELTPIIISYPKDLPLDYDDLERYLAERIIVEAPFAILGESFSGPLAIRFAVKNPKNLVAVILCATFMENPPVLTTRIQCIFAVNARQALIDCPKPVLYLYATKD
jgi:pimeloyl-ACP methyl ester carboxylesterase